MKMAAFSQLSICRPPPLRSGGNFIKDAEHAVFLLLNPNYSYIIIYYYYMNKYDLTINL